MMKNALLMITGLLILGTLSFSQPQDQSSDEGAGAAVVAFKTMVGVSGPYVGTSNPIRGIPGGGLPWAIADGRGSLKADGKLVIHVKGLVLAAGPLTGTNPVPTFKAVVSCQSIDSLGNPDVVNVGTQDFPADSAGDSNIEAKVELPSPCVAPMVFVTSPDGSWFAGTGK